MTCILIVFDLLGLAGLIRNCCEYSVTHCLHSILAGLGLQIQAWFKLNPPYFVKDSQIKKNNYIVELSIFQKIKQVPRI